MSKIINVYLSGPMTGLPDNNFPAFNAAAFALRMMGYSVVNPAQLGTKVGGLNSDQAWRQYMRADIKLLVDCNAIVMLPGWNESRGATLERLIAQGLKLPIMTLTDAALNSPLWAREQGLEWAYVVEGGAT